MAHECHAIGCTKRVPRVMFMCRSHWFRLPAKMRSAIWMTYRAGQCDDLHPSQAYCSAAQAALIWIAHQEKKTLTGTEPELVLYDALSYQPTAEIIRLICGAK